MSARELFRAPAMRVAGVVLAASAVVLVWSVATALRVEPLPDPPPPAVVRLASTRALRPTTDVQAAVENDPFSSDRSAPSAP
ncbi:MAG: hypothetical protein ACREMU_04335, partial [Gemmatimonadaceae bacterium]